WWGSMLALLFCLGWWLLHRDWRAGAVLLGVLAGWGPWFPLVTRTKFYDWWSHIWYRVGNGWV
ncbi:MAG TPA: hypothetical protein VFV73_21605, partial [Streptosporangiaceae bacterium]|nr:hypothetical protein [Streptosporangiaceae bacterium]